MVDVEECRLPNPKDYYGKQNKQRGIVIFLMEKEEDRNNNRRHNPTPGQGGCPILCCIDSLWVNDFLPLFVLALDRDHGW